MDLIIANILVTVPTGIFESLNACIFSPADAGVFLDLFLSFDNN